MPYIKRELRIGIYPEWEMDPQTSGELNYQLTVVAGAYLANKGLSYSTLNDILGAFEGAKLELYRRVAAPYEDTKIKENGDVY